jgi:tetratricopeptide (TPR) repeat protein
MGNMGAVYTNGTPLVSELKAANNVISAFQALYRVATSSAAPLEHVVQVRMHRATRDYAYVARHPEIAQILFQQVLSERTDRYNEYVRILKYLNVAYSSDRESFRKLVRAKVLNDLFRHREDVLAIFEVAKESTGQEAYLYQQMAIYERMNGNYSRAHELLQTARELDPQDTSVVHTMADLARIRANAASLSLERQRFRNEAYSILNDLPYQSRTDRYASHTFVLLAKDILQDLLSDRESTNRDIDEAVRNVERALDEARQKFPEETLFKTAEADFARLLSDDDRAARALEWAFRTNPRDPYIATSNSTIATLSFYERPTLSILITLCTISEERSRNGTTTTKRNFGMRGMRLIATMSRRDGKQSRFSGGSEMFRCNMTLGTGCAIA